MTPKNTIDERVSINGAKISYLLFSLKQKMNFVKQILGYGDFQEYNEKGIGGLQKMGWSIKCGICSTQPNVMDKEIKRVSEWQRENNAVTKVGLTKKIFLSLMENNGL